MVRMVNARWTGQVSENTLRPPPSGQKEIRVDANDDCGICLEELTAEGTGHLVILRCCRKVLHENCLQIWSDQLPEWQVCPNCQHLLSYEELSQRKEERVREMAAERARRERQEMLNDMRSWERREFLDNERCNERNQKNRRRAQRLQALLGQDPGGDEDFEYFRDLNALRGHVGQVEASRRVREEHDRWMRDYSQRVAADVDYGRRLQLPREDSASSALARYLQEQHDHPLAALVDGIEGRLGGCRGRSEQENHDFEFARHLRDEKDRMMSHQQEVRDVRDHQQQERQLEDPLIEDQQRLLDHFRGAHRPPLPEPVPRVNQDSREYLDDFLRRDANNFGRDMLRRPHDVHHYSDNGITRRLMPPHHLQLPVYWDNNCREIENNNLNFRPMTYAPFYHDTRHGHVVAGHFLLEPVPAQTATHHRQGNWHEAVAAARKWRP